jgi:Rha family phage regulatory protein
MNGDLTKMIDTVRLVCEPGRILVSSKEVAEKFKREHHNVLRSIRHLWTILPSDVCSRNFLPVENTNPLQRGEYSEILMTCEGFSLLTLGFTGTESREWKLRFVEVFKSQEDIIKEAWDQELWELSLER